MKKKMMVVVFLCLLSMLAACSLTPKEQLESTGLFGEHSLIRSDGFNAIEGESSGNYFTGVGITNGMISSDYKLQFQWSPKPGHFLITPLPVEYFRIVIDEKKDVPTIEFVFNKAWLSQWPETTDKDGKKKSDTDKVIDKNNLNLNKLILSPKMQVAIIRVSSAALEKEEYLPRLISAPSPPKNVVEEKKEASK